jgi:hypothetical protein
VGNHLLDCKQQTHQLGEKPHPNIEHILCGFKGSLRILLLWDPQVFVTCSCTVDTELVIILHLLHLDKQMIIFLPNSLPDLRSSGILHSTDW